MAEADEGVLAGQQGPGLPVRELNDVPRRNYEATGLWASRGWVSGYEMGIAFFPDRVGNFVYDPPGREERGSRPRAGTAVNYEVQFSCRGTRAASSQSRPAVRRRACNACDGAGSLRACGCPVRFGLSRPTLPRPRPVYRLEGNPRALDDLGHALEARCGALPLQLLPNIGEARKRTIYLPLVLHHERIGTRQTLITPLPKAKIAPSRSMNVERFHDDVRSTPPRCCGGGVP